MSSVQIGQDNLEEPIIAPIAPHRLSSSGHNFNISTQPKVKQCGEKMF